MIEDKVLESQLSVGNYFLDLDDGIVQWDFQMKRNVEFENQYVGQGIVLTTEMFLRLGFRKDGDFFKVSRLDIDYCFNYRDFKDDYTFRVEYTDSGDPNDDGKKYPVSFGLKYVHEIQNLIYHVSKGDIEPINLKLDSYEI